MLVQPDAPPASGLSPRGAFARRPARRRVSRPRPSFPWTRTTGGLPLRKAAGGRGRSVRVHLTSRSAGGRSALVSIPPCLRTPHRYGTPPPRRRTVSFPPTAEGTAGTQSLGARSTPAAAAAAVGSDVGDTLHCSKSAVAALRRSPGAVWVRRAIDGSCAVADLSAYLGVAPGLLEAITTFPGYFHTSPTGAEPVRVRAAAGVTAPGVLPGLLALPLAREASAPAQGALRRGRWH